MVKALRQAQASGGSRRWFSRAVALGAALAASPVSAAIVITHQQQSPGPTTAATPEPPYPTDINSEVSSNAAVTELGSNFLRRLGNQATYGFGKALGSNPAGGGASAADEPPRYRSWAEAYTNWSQTGAQGTFLGDHRNTVGGVAGIGARLMPGINVGLSVDQSHTRIDVPLALQSAKLDLTQIGVNASFERGAWTVAIAGVHGFGDIDTSRDTGAGFARASYGARIDGALTELSYYWSEGQSRIVPKAAFEYVRATTGSFQEQGGQFPVTATGATGERARVLAGAEFGHYFIIDQKILDLSAYGKFVDNVMQDFSNVTVSLGAQSISVQGIGESRTGADAGAAASLSLSNTARLYLNYDGKFRTTNQSHQATLGLELKW
jgi:uncharacterized protein with beta-barrel porin domain